MDTIVMESWPKVDIDEFLPELRLELDEVPDDILMHYVRQGAIWYAERTHCLQRTVTICTYACVPNYILEAPDADCMRVVAVSGVCSCGLPWERLTAAPCFIRCMGRSAWWDREEGSLVLHPAPSETMEVTVRMSVAPRHDACELDRSLAEAHRFGVLNAARWLLYSIPNRKWSSQPLATTFRQELDRNVAAAGNDRLFGGMQGSIRMRHTLSRR